MVTGIVNGVYKGISLNIGEYHNLGMRFADNQVTICAADLSDLSVDNPALIGMKKDGALGAITIPITANVTFNNGGHASPDLLSNFNTNSDAGIESFGTGIDRLPFILHALNRDNDPALCKFMLARYPVWQILSTDLGHLVKMGVASTRPITILDSSVTANDYLGSPATPIFVIDGLISAGTYPSFGAVTLDEPGSFASAQNSYRDYKRVYSKVYTLAPTQGVGAIVGGHCVSVDAPIWASEVYNYMIVGDCLNNDDYVKWAYNLKFSGVCTNGADTDDFSITKPFLTGSYSTPAAVARIGGAIVDVYASRDGGSYIKLVKTADGTEVENNDFSDAGDYVMISSGAW